MKTHLSILLCALSSSLACPEPETSSPFDPDVSPFLRVRGGAFSHVYVWAEVNDAVAGWFTFDSGAQGHRLSKAAAEGLGLTLRPMGTVSGVGASVKAYSVRADTLSVGPLTMNAPEFFVTETAGAGENGLLGTLGSDLFKQSVVVYDQAGPSVALYDPATYEPPPVEWEECVLLDERPFAHMRIEQQEVLLEIDTGGGQGVLLCTPAVERLGLADGRPSNDNLIFGPYGSAPVRITTLASVDVGAQRFDDVLGTLGVEHHGWLGSTEHDGLIGAPLLSYMVVIFDYGKQRISFTDRRLFPLLADGFKLVESALKSASQAAGAPNAMDQATYGQAWWPEDSHGQHWLELTYAEPIQPTRMEIWGTYGQGALTAVQMTTERGESMPIDWAGSVEETLADGLALTAATLETREPVVKLRLDFDCSQIEGTNVVDAVGLVDAAGITHWALDAHANGGRHPVARPDLDVHDALEKHATRLQQRGQSAEAESVRRRLKQLGEG